MSWYGIDWKKKDTHNKHLSVLDYKKQERAKEVAALEEEIEGAQVVLELKRNGLILWRRKLKVSKTVLEKNSLRLKRS